MGSDLVRYRTIGVRSAKALPLTAVGANEDASPALATQATFCSSSPARSAARRHSCLRSVANMPGSSVDSVTVAPAAGKTVPGSRQSSARRRCAGSRSRALPTALVRRPGARAAPDHPRRGGHARSGRRSDRPGPSAPASMPAARRVEAVTVSSVQRTLEAAACRAAPTTRETMPSESRIRQMTAT